VVENRWPSTNADTGDTRRPHGALDAGSWCCPLRLGKALPAAARHPPHDAALVWPFCAPGSSISPITWSCCRGSSRSSPVHPGRWQVLLDLHVRPGGLRVFSRPWPGRPHRADLSRTTRFRSISAGRSRAGAMPRPADGSRRDAVGRHSGSGLLLFGLQVGWLAAGGSGPTGRSARHGAGFLCGCWS